MRGGARQELLLRGRELEGKGLAPDDTFCDKFEGLLHSEQCDEIELKKIKAMDYF